ncbi:MAG: ATP-grasp fold amidoligase family protein [Nitrospira sp.]|nr:ATP-grasp fold amidoligase family protein [Nitrospira sp.]
MRQSSAVLVKVAARLYGRLRRVSLALYRRHVSSSILNVVLYPTYLFQFVVVHHRLPMKPDRLFNDFLFQVKSGAELESPLRRRVSDKEYCKLYTEERIGAGTTTPTICVLRTADEVERYRPPAFPCVIKPTNSSGRVIIARSKTEYIEALPRIKNWFHEDYFVSDLEKNYATLERKVIIEEYIDDSFSLEGSVHCLRGEPKLVSLIDRYTKARQTFDIAGTPLGVSLYYPLKEFEPASWDFLPGLLSQSRILSAEFTYIRVDFFTDTKRVLFGELTNLPAGGIGRFYPADGEKIFSEVFFRPARRQSPAANSPSNSLFAC